ncbi:MAG: hypothetical protein VKQ33_00195 [Candidatus Sericytochromatia bacterium]|nr:hypothetical protein [Candidatus Sericytochromatia bacterium]
MTMRIVAAIGEGPGGLGGLWRPMAWVPAIEAIQGHLARWAAQGPLCVRSTLEAGFPLMAAAAALRARDAGLPVRLEVVLPHPLPDEAQEPRAILAWARRALARADAHQVLFARPAHTRHEHAALRLETERALLADGAFVLACWNGRRGSRTWSALEHAQRLGCPVEHLYPAVTTALQRDRERPAPWGEEETG